MYILGKSYLKEQKTKSLGGSIGRNLDRFDPNAIDGDDDGKVQDGTRFERPSISRRMPTSRRIAGKISPSPIIKPENPLFKDNIKSFDGFDPEQIKTRLKEAEDYVIKKFGQMKTVGDALNAFKTIFGKVDLRDYGDAIGQRADIDQDLSLSELYSVYGLLFTLDGVPALKKRKAIIEHDDDGQYLGINGSTQTLSKIREDRDDFKEYGLRIQVPFHFELIKTKLLEDSDGLYADGVSTQIAKSIFRQAMEEQDENKKEQLINLAISAFSFSVSSHEAVHAIDVPNRFDRITDEIKRKNPNLKTEFDVLKQLANSESSYDLLELEMMQILLDNVNSGSTGKAIQLAIQYETLGPEKLAEQMEEHANALQQVLEDMRTELASLEQIFDDPNVDIMQRMQVALASKQLEVMMDTLENEIQQSKSFSFELKQQIDDGTPESSYIGTVHKVVYNSGLNFLYEIAPIGHPAYGKDVEKTVDELGNIVSATMQDKEIKNQKATAEFLKSMLISLIGNDKFVDAVEDLNMSFNGMESMIGKPSLLINNGTDIDFSQVLNTLDADYRQRLETNQYLKFAYSHIDTWWPETISEKTRWRLLNWMKQVSDYGSDSHYRYFQGVNFFSPQNMISVEVFAELLASLNIGGGAARVPMPADVKNAVIDILNWLYPGNAWKSKLPAVSLEALGL